MCRSSKACCLFLAASYALLCTCCALPSACCALPSACCALPSACCALPSACCALPFACCALPSACCALPSACGALPSACCALPSACCALPSTCCALSAAPAYPCLQSCSSNLAFPLRCCSMALHRPNAMPVILDFAALDSRQCQQCSHTDAPWGIECVTMMHPTSPHQPSVGLSVAPLDRLHTWQIPSCTLKPF